jgi:hypothetical protein
MNVPILRSRDKERSHAPVGYPLPPITQPVQPAGRRGRSVPVVIVATVVVAVVVAVSAAWIRSLDGDMSDVRTDNAALSERVGSLEDLFPLTTSSMSDAELTGRYRTAFTPVQGLCTYDDCADIGTPSFTLVISRRSSQGYGLAVEGVGGPPAPMQRIGSVHSAGGLLPRAMWGTCEGAPSPTSFEFLLVTIGVDLVDGELRAVETTGVYRQYDSSGTCSGGSESSFHGVRVE